VKREIDSKKIKIIFMGTPEFSEIVLQKIISEKYQVTSVFTGPDKKSGRGQLIKESPVKKLALKYGIRIYQPRDLRDSKLAEAVKESKPDLIISAAYGNIIPKNILDIPKYGSLNVHASLLPKMRGASPIQNAILKGEKETGVTIMLMDEGVDTGGILKAEKITISNDDNQGSLTLKLAMLGADALIKTIPRWISKELRPIPQNDSLATYTKIIAKKDGRIDWHEPAAAIERRLRALSFWPGIHTFMNDGGKRTRLIIKTIDIETSFKAGIKPGKVIQYNKEIAITTGKGLLLLKKIQPEGKKIMDIRDFIRGRSNFLNSFLD
jgi:methionyl-tRNA formyltransferase